MTKYRTKNNLPESTRASMVALLNARLVDSIDLALQSKQAHWNVKGPHFIALHELFDQVRDSVDEWSDTIAERAVILGGIADGTKEAVSSSSTLPAYPRELASGRNHVDTLSTALAVFGEKVRQAITAADEAGDDDTADLFTEVSRGVDKMTWFVEAHLQGE